MNLAKLTANPGQCKTLQTLGINVPSLLCHFATGAGPDGWVVAPVFSIESFFETRPAWTKEELDAMIGPEFSKPDLWKPDKVGKEQDPESYPVYYPDKMRIFKKGAEASADALIFLLQNKHVRAYDANTRYAALFLKDVNNEG
jgi:hypothetical protein